MTALPTLTFAPHFIEVSTCRERNNFIGLVLLSGVLLVAPHSSDNTLNGNTVAHFRAGKFPLSVRLILPHYVCVLRVFMLVGSQCLC